MMSIAHERLQGGMWLQVVCNQIDETVNVEPSITSYIKAYKYERDTGPGHANEDAITKDAHRADTTHNRHQT